MSTSAFRLASTSAAVERAEAARRRRRLPNGLTPEEDAELRRLAAAAIDACNRVIATATREITLDLDPDQPKGTP